MTGGASTPPSAIELQAPPLALHEVDRRIWEEELADFVPDRIFDVHTHLYRWTFNLDPNKETGPYKKFAGEEWSEATWDLADACDQALFPGRRVHRLSFPFPFSPACDFSASNAFVAEQTSVDPGSAALMLVRPGMSVEEVEKEIDRFGFVGFKPYRFYSVTGDARDCRITDFMPEELLAVADRRNLIVMMHLAKKDAIADPENLADLERLCERYPNARWVLAHCARSYSAWPIERAGPRLRRLPNVWFDTSSVCESDAIDALIDSVGVGRVMYGSDDLPVGVLRGKYVAFGYAWTYISPSNQSFDLSHCDGRMTFTRYEQTRAMRRAAKRQGLTRVEIEGLFHDVAANLVATSGGRTE